MRSFAPTGHRHTAEVNQELGLHHVYLSITSVELVRGVLRGAWRSSSLVEGLNSVLRMQQARHRRLPQGLLDLKRLSWNCRRLRTGRRKGQTPSARLGVRLPD